MNILFTIGRYWPAIGGAESLVRELASRLALSHNVAVAALVNDNNPDFLGKLRGASLARSYQDGRISVHLLRAGVLRRLHLEGYIQLACRGRLPRLQQRLFAAAYEAQLDALMGRADLVHSLPAMSLPLVRLAADLACRRGIPFVITPHMHSAEEARDLRDIFDRASGIIALTAVEREWIREAGMASARIEVTGLGPSLGAEARPGEFRLRHGVDGFLVLFIGRKEVYKGYRQLLEAAPRVWQKQPDTSFVFIGPPTPESEQDFAGWRKERRILELPGVDEEQKAQALADCDLLCVPSTRESFGHIYLEAWNAGKPVIAADIPVERAVIEHGEDGLLAAQEPMAIAEAILFLLKNPQEAGRMGERGREKVRQRYNWQNIFFQTCAFYERLLEKERRVQCPSAVF